MAAASAVVVTASLLATTPAAASSPTALYAYAGGGANPSGCPSESTPSSGCSLSQALVQAAAGDSVLLAGDATYVGTWTVQTSGTSLIDPVTIEPAVGASPILDGNGGSATGCSTTSCSGPVLSVDSGVFADLSGVTIEQGVSSYGGGGINNLGSLGVTSSTLSGNSAQGLETNGGGIYNGGMLSITDSMLLGNSAGEGYGGGIYNGSGTLTISSSTFSENSATNGGGIFNYSQLSVSTSTFAGDSVGGGGGAIANEGGTAQVTSSTFDGNSTQEIGGAIWTYLATTTLAGDIFADGAAAASGGECASSYAGGTTVDAGYNIDDDGSCGFSSANGSVSNSPAIDGFMGSLGDYGGPTETVPLLAVSSSPGHGADPALGLVPAGATVPGSSTTICSLPDQRGITRTSPCDAGSFEQRMLYAYAGGAAASPVSCPQSASATAECSLAQALSMALPADIVLLATSGSSSSYAGSWVVQTAGTSSGGPVTIEPAPGVTNPTLDGGGGGTVLSVSSGVYADVSGVTIEHGEGSVTGGGVVNDGTLQLSDSTLTDNSSLSLSGFISAPAFGGGIYNGGSLDLSDSSLTDNSASVVSGGSPIVVLGGGIYNTGTLSVTGSSFTGNETTSSDIGVGGAIYSTGTLAVSDSTFADNTSNVGGAIASDGTATISASSFAGNSVTLAGGGGGGTGGALVLSGTASVLSSTFDANSAAASGGGASVAGGSGTTLEADIFANEQSGGECSGTMTDAGSNVDDDGTCGLSSANGSVSDSPAIDGYLGTLGNYGGPTGDHPAPSGLGPARPGSRPRPRPRAGECHRPGRLDDALLAARSAGGNAGEPVRRRCVRAAQRPLRRRPRNGGATDVVSRHHRQ